MLTIVTKEQKHIIEYMGAKFTVIPNTKEEAQAIIKDNTYSHKVETPMGRSDQYEERVNFTGVHIDNMVSQVVAWEGIADNLECTPEAKKDLAQRKENEHICIHIQQEIAKIGQAEEVKEEKKKGN